MTDGSLAAFAAYSAPETEQPFAAQPTAAQAAQFEQLAHYDAPPSPAVEQGDFRPVLDHMAQVSDKIRSALESYPRIDAQQRAKVSPEVQASIEMQQEMVAHTIALMSFTYMTKMAELTQNNLKTLLQQQG